MEAGGEWWVAASELGRALGVGENSVRHLIQRHREQLAGYMTTFEEIWKQGPYRTVQAGEETTTSGAGVRQRADTIFLNRRGMLAVVLKIEPSRIKVAEARETVNQSVRWALEVLDVAMAGRALPAGSGVGANERPRLDARTADILKALARNGHRLPVSLLVPLAASVGITLDPAAVEAERAEVARPGRGGAPVALAAVGEQPTSAAPEDPAEKGARYLSALRRVIVQNSHRLAGLEERGKDGSVVVPRQGYIGGVGRAYGVEVVGIQPRALQALLAPVLGQYNARDFLAAMEKHVVAVPDPDAPEGQGVKRVSVLVTPGDQRTRQGKALGIRYRRADGKTTTRCLLCFRRDAVLGDGTAAGGGAR